MQAHADGATHQANLALLLKLTSTPGPDQLYAAVAAVESRHEALRTNVVTTGGTLGERVEPVPRVIPRWLAGTMASDPEPESAWREAMSAPFELAGDPLFRVAARPDGDGSCWIALVASPVIADRTSLTIVGQDLVVELSGAAAPDPPPGYGARRRRDPALADRDLKFLAQRLSEPTEPIALPGRDPGRTVHGYAAGYLAMELGDAADLEAFAARHQVGVDAVLLAVLRMLLSWYSGRWDLAIATMQDPRQPPDERLVGPLQNLVPVSLRARPEQDFAWLISDCANELVTAARHCHARFEELADQLPVSSDDVPQPLNVAFEYAAGPALSGRRPELRAVRYYPTTGYRADLELFFCRDEGALTAHVGYNRQFFWTGQMHRFCAHYLALLRQATRYPRTEAGAFEPLTAAERLQQITTWNATAATYPQTTIHALVRARAEAQPDAIALTGPHRRTSYRELVTRAQSIAGGLVTGGVRPGDFVLLLLPRGTGRVEAMLAVLFAGAAYVPVEPDAPPERLAFIVRNSGLRHAITDERAGQAVLSGAGVRVMSLDRLAAAAVMADGQTPPLPEVGPGQPAYCLYTSGTTGRPKGVVITHRNVVRLIQNDRFPFRVGPDDVWTMFHSYSFDISVWEVYCCLLHGGRLVVAGEDAVNDMRRYWQLVQREKVTVLELTPSAFAMFSEVASSDPMSSRIRYLFLGGEKLQPRLVAAWMRRWPAVTVVNAYGPTEVTVRATARILDQADVESDVSNIGSPIPTTTVYLLDPETRSRLLPAGAIGEVAVGGLGVASGYLGQPELSAKSFVPDPFGGGLLFRTGDLARYRPDGTLEYLGRRDSQVKLRGYRVEPDEVASCLREHPSVAEAVVLVDDRAPVSLAAYLRWRGEGTGSASLRAHLATLLPSYMIPARFSVIDRIPLTRNGKLDKSALLAQAAELPEEIAQPLATPTAVALADIWSTLLGRPTHDGGGSFFELGGDSLLAMRLTAGVAERMGSIVEVRTVFEHPRLQELADYIDTLPRRPLPRQRALIPPGSVLRAPSSIQERIWFAEQMEPAGPLYNVPLAWQVHGNLDTGALRDALGLLIARHEILRTRFTDRGGRLRQVIDRPWVPDLEIVDMSQTPPDRWQGAVTLRLRAEAGQAFDLSAGRLLRVALLRFTETEQALVLSTHHLVWDEVSTTIFLGELERCYAAPGGEKDRGLPPARQYQAFADQQRKHAADQAGIEYWSKLLRGAPGYLPLVRPTPAAEHGTVRFSLRPGMSGRFRQLRAARRVSPFMVIAAAVAVAMHTWTGQPDVTFGCPVANRDSEETAEVIGPCLNLVVLRSRCEPRTTVADVLAAMRDWILGMLDHQNVPFEAVVSRLAPPRRAGWTPYADVTVNLPGADPKQLALGPATLAPLPVDQWEQEIKFSLSIMVIQENGDYRGVVSYRGDRLRRADAERLARSLGWLLDHFPDLLGRPLSALGLTSSESAVRDSAG